MANYDYDIFCVTCGESPDLDKEDTGDWDAYGHTDGAHYPNWSDTPSEELSIMTDLINGVYLADTGRLPCNECRRITGHKMDCSHGR